MTESSGGDPLRRTDDAQPGSPPGGDLELRPPEPALSLEALPPAETVPAPEAGATDGADAGQAAEAAVVASSEAPPDAGAVAASASVAADASAAPAASDPGTRSLWAEILRTPLAKGVLPGTLLLLVAMALVSWLEGGSSRDARRYQTWIQAALLIPSVALLGLYARRITLCTIEEREIPAGTDGADETPWHVGAGLFAVVVFISILPVFVWTSIQSAVGAPTWVSLAVVALCMVPAALHFPFAHAAVTLKADALAAFPGRSIAVWRTDRDSARIAVGPSYAFFALVVLSITLSALFNPRVDDNFDPSAAELRRQAVADHTLLRDLGRAGMFVIRAGAVWAALVSARVSGLLARDVPAIREILER